MGIQVGGRLFSYNRTLKLPDEDGTLATQEYHNSHLGGGAGGIVNITYAALVTAIGASGLTAGQQYKITDRGLFFTAISTNQLAKNGTRLMLCPAFYGTGENNGDGNNWIGVWNATKNPAINDLTIWGGLVWKSLTGNIGTADSDILLDAVNWEVVPKASFSNDEYIEMVFGVCFDVANDWIEKQWDGSGNIFGLDFYSNTNYGYSFNLCDVSDWNFATSGNSFFGNTCDGVFNNSGASSDIAYNSNDGAIFNNSNTEDIYGNTNTGAIKSNSNTGLIENNTNHGQIYNNSNGGNILENSNIGRISDNSNTGFILRNSNNGNIINIGSVNTNIQYNINNGNIATTTTDDISDTVVDK